MKYSVQSGQTLDADVYSLCALRAEGIGIAVGLDAGSVGSGVVSWIAETGLHSIASNSGDSVLFGVAGGADGGRGDAGETLGVALVAGTSEVGVVQFVVSVLAGADSAGEVPELGWVAGGAGRGVVAGVAGGGAGRAVDCARIVVSFDAFAALSDVSVENVDAGETGTVGRGAVLALVRTLLTGGSVDEEAVAAGAGESDVVEVGSDLAGCALNGITGIANRAEGSSAGVALEGLSRIEVKSTGAGAGTVVGVVG